MDEETCKMKEGKKTMSSERIKREKRKKERENRLKAKRMEREKGREEKKEGDTDMKRQEG